MRLLVVTQKVDASDPILGFFHRWIAEFAAQCESVIVIGQYVTDFHLPPNVKVLSLKKERGSWRITQVLRYRWLLWKYRREYDAIFVHMTPIWGVFAWRMVIFFRKPLYLWYEARGTRWPLKVAVWLATKVFSASAAGMPIKTSKSVITGHGIAVDTSAFDTSAMVRDVHLVVTVGRITASKNLPVIIHAFETLPQESRLFLAGAPLTSDDHALLSRLRLMFHQKGMEHRVEVRSLSQQEVASMLKKAALFLHASSTSLDKALLEAMASGCLVVSCAEAARSVLPKECLATPEGMGDRAKTLLALPPEEQDALRGKLRELVVKDHSLPRLIERLMEEMS